MPEKKPKSFLSVSSSIAVLLECEYDQRDGVTYYEDEKDIDNAVTALQSDGIRNGTGPKGRGRHGRPVRRVRPKELMNRKLLAEIAGGSPGWIDFLTGVKKLHGLKSAAQDPVVFAEAYRFMAAELGFDPRQEPKSTFYSMLVPALVHALDGLHVVFWRTKDGELLPGLYAPDKNTAMKTAAAACWLLSPELRVCTHCSQIFIAKRPKQTAHNAKCRDAHRLIRFRSKGKVAA